MTDSYLTVMQEVITKLKASGTISGFVGARVYTDVPDNPTFPFIYCNMDSADFSTKATTAMEHTLQVNCFSRLTSPNECAQIRAAVYDLLNRGESNLSGAAISNILFNGIGNIAKETDGKTWNGFLQFRIIML